MEMKSQKNIPEKLSANNQLRSSVSVKPTYLIENEGFTEEASFSCDSCAGLLLISVFIQKKVM